MADIQLIQYKNQQKTSSSADAGFLVISLNRGLRKAKIIRYSIMKFLLL